MKDQLDKATKDLARLREHLMDTEEAHTRDIMTKEDQITELRTQCVFSSICSQLL
jgi:hypothetical protein